jgi:alpha-L-fucosidase 2
MFALCGRALQVDGNFGVTAAVTEMLMQSHDGFIKLLPALPDEWSEGAFKGICARGGFQLDFTWKYKKVTQLKILSKSGEPCRIESRPGLKISSNGIKLKFKKLPGGLIEFKTLKNAVYLIN